MYNKFIITINFVLIKHLESYDLFTSWEHCICSYMPPRRQIIHTVYASKYSLIFNMIVSLTLIAFYMSLNYMWWFSSSCNFNIRYHCLLCCFSHWLHILIVILHQQKLWPELCYTHNFCTLQHKTSHKS